MAVHAVCKPPPFLFNQLLDTMHLSTAHPASKRHAGGTHVHYTLWLHEVWQSSWLPWWSYSIPLSKSPSCSSLPPSWTGTMTFVTWFWLPHVCVCTNKWIGQRGRLSLRHQRHSVVGVLTIQRAQSNWLPALPSVVSDKRSTSDGRHLIFRKALSEERPQSIGGESCHVTEAQMEQEKKEIGEKCYTTNAHLQKVWGGLIKRDRKRKSCT